MWIKLHFYWSGDEIAVQTQNICAIYPDQREEYIGVTNIQFAGTEDNYLTVRETIDEIGAMITRMTELNLEKAKQNRKTVMRGE